MGVGGSGDDHDLDPGRLDQFSQARGDPYVRDQLTGRLDPDGVGIRHRPQAQPRHSRNGGDVVGADGAETKHA